MDSDGTRNIIARAQAGDAEAYESLLDEYGPRLYGYFLRATGRHHDAEDLLSEILLRLVRTLKSYDHRGRFEPWLFRIAANMVRDRIRRRRARPQPVSLSIEDDSGRTLAAEIPAAGLGVDAEALAAEASMELRDALDQLDETSRQMLLLRHFGNLSFKEIAGMFDCPLGTALAKVHRGLRALRRLLDAEEE
jgi:RNA polymerase sigma-70 factor (ECF subfamily)